MSVLEILTSLHGRRFGLTSSGGLMIRHPATAPVNSRALTLSTAGTVNETITLFNATVAEITVQDLKSVVVATETTATTMANYSHSILSTAAATVQFFVMTAPEVGLMKSIVVGRNTASEITIQGTATTILFGSTSGDKIFLTGADLRGVGVLLVGESTTRWSVLSRGGSTVTVTLTGGT